MARASLVVWLHPDRVPRSSSIGRSDIAGDAPVTVTYHAPTDCRPSRAAVTHELAVVGFYTGGRATFEQHGRWTLEPGDVVLVPAGAPHRMLEAERPELWGVGFCVPCFAAEDAAALLEPFERVRAGASAVVRIPSERHAFLGSLFQELQRVSASPRAGALAVQRSLLTLILDEVTRAADWDEHATGGGSVVAESLRVIERQCLGPLTLEDVARAVGRTPSYVTTSLSRATGRSAVAWIIAGRMAEARRLLLHSDERIEDVAERVGYADVTHFTRMFRRAHGATPTAWRAAQRRSD